MPDIAEVFGSNVFNERIMKERLPKETFKALRKTVEKGYPLTIEVANDLIYIKFITDVSFEHIAFGLKHLEKLYCNTIPTVTVQRRIANLPKKY